MQSIRTPPVHLHSPNDTGGETHGNNHIHAVHTPYPQLVAGNSASTGLNTAPVALKDPVQTTMVAASVPQPTMVPPPVPSLPDPRQVVSPLDPNKVEAKLHELGILAQWQHVVDDLCSGFNVGATAPIPHSLQFRNHTLSELAPEFIDEYITQEQAAGRYSQAFNPAELEGIIGCFCTSPLGLVPKSGTSKF